MKKSIDVAEFYELIESCADHDEHEFDDSPNEFFDKCEQLICLPELSLMYCFDRCIITYDPDLLDRYDTIAEFADAQISIELLELIRLFDCD